jgi:hypothetical protein
MGKSTGKMNGSLLNGKKDLKQKVRDAYGKLEDKFLEKRREKKVNQFNKMASKEGLKLTDKGNPKIRTSGGGMFGRYVSKEKIDDNMKSKEVNKYSIGGNQTKYKKVITTGGPIEKNKLKTTIKFKKNGDTVTKEKNVSGPLFNKDRKVKVTREDASGKKIQVIKRKG